VLRAPRVIVREEPSDEPAGPLTQPSRPELRSVTKSVATVADGEQGVRLGMSGETEMVATADDALDLRSADAVLSADSGVDPWELLNELRALYGDGDIPLEDITPLRDQLDLRGPKYVMDTEVADRVFELVRNEGFNFDEVDACYWARISYDK